MKLTKSLKSLTLIMAIVGCETADSQTNKYSKPKENKTNLIYYFYV